MSTGPCENPVSTDKRTQNARSLLSVRPVLAKLSLNKSIRYGCKNTAVAKIIEIIEESYRGSVIILLCWDFLLNQASIRRFIFTLITGYLAIFGVQKIPYEFPNRWAVLIPVLIVVYIITVWLDGVFFKDNESPEKLSADVKKAKRKKSSKKSNGFGDS